MQPVGKLVLNRTPTNFFAETEQVAFHLGHLPPGIDVTNDPLLQGRLFSYLDTQLTRLGGPNFTQIPINRPHAPVNDMLRDGFHQHAVHAGVAPYRPNSLDGGNPFPAGDAEHAFVDVPVTVAEAPKVRANPASFDDHYSQVRLFWLSMSPVEKEHIIRAYTFELGKCYEQAIKERQLQCLANIDPVLCAQVADRPRPARAGADRRRSPTSRPARRCPRSARRGRPTAASIGIVVDPDGDLDGVDEVREAVFAAGMVPLLIAPHGGTVGDLPVQRTFATARSVEFDAVLLAAAPAPAPDALPARDAKAGAAGAGRPWTRACCCWSRSAGGTPRRSAPGAPAARCWSRPASPARPASSRRTRRRGADRRAAAAGRAPGVGTVPRLGRLTQRVATITGEGCPPQYGRTALARAQAVISGSTAGGPAGATAPLLDQRPARGALADRTQAHPAVGVDQVLVPVEGEPLGRCRVAGGELICRSGVAGSARARPGSARPAAHSRPASSSRAGCGPGRPGSPRAGAGPDPVP